MKVSLEKQGQNVVQLGLEVDAQRAVKAYEVACRELSHKVNIPGFRRGKAPRNIIEKALGVDYIKQQALEKLVPEVLQKAISDEKLDIITEPEIENWNFELGEPLTLSAKVEIRPEVKLGQYDGLKVEVAEATVKPDHLDTILNNLLESKATLSEVPNRKLKIGDTAVLDFECHVDGKLAQGGKAEGLILEIKPGGFIDNFCEQLVGKEAGTQTEVKVTFPAEYRNNELAGKEATFHVDIKGVREKVLPDLNDELAKAVGYESVAGLKEGVSQRLEEQAKEETEIRKHKAVVEAVVAQSSVDVPDTMLDREVELLLRQVKHAIEQNGRDFEDFSKSAEFEGIKAEKREEALKRVTTSLILGAIVRAENINISPDEVGPYLYELAEQYNISVEQAAKHDGLRRKAMEDVLTNKVVEHLVSRANITLVPEEGETPSKGKAKKEVKQTAEAK